MLVTTSSKWFYMLNSDEKWLCESKKKNPLIREGPNSSSIYQYSDQCLFCLSSKVRQIFWNLKSVVTYGIKLNT
jgi:hypothetical protein